MIRWWLSVCLLAAGDERRGDDTPPAGETLTLPFVCRFADGAIVSAGRYDLMRIDGMVVLTSRGDEVLRLAATPTPFEAKKAAGPLTTSIKGDRFIALGVIGGEPAELSCQRSDLAERGSVLHLNEQAASAPAASSLPALKDDAMVKRMKGLLDDCSDKARRRGYRLDDGKYEKCVCPLLAKVKFAPTSGFTLALDPQTEVRVTTTPAGRVSQCALQRRAPAP